MKKMLFVIAIILNPMSSEAMWRRVGFSAKTHLSQFVRKTKSSAYTKPLLVCSGLLTGAGGVAWKWRQYNKQKREEADQIQSKAMQEFALDDFCQRYNLKQPQSYTTDRVNEIVDSLGYKGICRIVTKTGLAGEGAIYYNVFFGQHILAVNEEKFNVASPEVQKFVIAHEISHGLFADEQRVFSSGPAKEKACDLRAVELLGTARGGIERFQREGYLAPILYLYDWLMHNALKGLPSATHPADYERLAYLQECQTQYENKTKRRS